MDSGPRCNSYCMSHISEMGRYVDGTWVVGSDGEMTFETIQTLPKVFCNS